jgi:hypothetical protein
MGESVVVDVTIKNVGNAGTKIEVADTLPDSAFLKEGTMSLKNWSDAGSVHNFRYTMIMDKEGNIELPAAVGNYTDVEYKGMVRSATSSDKLVITVIDPKKVTPTPIPTQIPADDTIVIPGFSGFSGIFAIIGVLIITKYRIKSRIKKE